MPKLKWLVASGLAIGMVIATQNIAFARDDKDKDKDGARDSRPIVTEQTAGAPPAGFASWGDVMKVQTRLDEKAERIVATRDDSFAGIAVAPERNALTVYWKGTPSADATAAMEKARSDGDTVDLQPAEYSEAELMAEGNKIAEQDGVTAVAPKVDGSGLLVSMLPGALPLLFTPVPITTDVSEPVAASRLDDSSPYWGGARWRLVGSGQCSSGFAISINGAKKMLSAGHCGDNGQTAADGGGQIMGTIAGDNNSRDRLYINTNSAGRIYNGGVGSGEFSNPVIGASRSFVGDFVCSSGSYSGTRCNNRVVATNQTINIGYLVFETVRAEQQNREAAVGNGDSGGSVFSVPSDNTKVIAKGTNTAIDLQTVRPCTGVPTGAGRQCAWRFWYADAQLSLNAYGAKIVTG